MSLFASNNTSKLLILNAIEYHQLEVGVEQLFLSSSHDKLQLATSTWITRLWEFLNLHRLELCLPSLNLSLSLHVNGSTIVDLLLNLGFKDENLN